MTGDGLELPGSARGPILGLAPPTRLLLGLAGIALVLTSDPLRPAGAAVLALTVAGLLAAGRLPARALRRVLVLGAALLLPLALLTPLVAGGVEVPVRIAVRGLAVMLVSAVTLGSLGGADLPAALAGLRAPPLVVAIVVQIVHQAGTLVHESRRLAGAMAVRGATGGGRAALRVVTSLPTVWLPRVVDRAERVAAAMELRGFGAEIPVRAERRAGRADHLARIGAVLVVVAAGLVRHGGW
jgi:energy-coupling factor transporter transmembrane protein EcfT